MIWFGEKRSPDIPPLLAEPFVGERVDDLVALCDLLARHPFSMWQFGEHVLIQRAGTCITVAPYRMKWFGPHTPGILFDPEHAVGGLFQDDPIEDEDRGALLMLIRKAEHRRKSGFRRCATCEELTPPEWLDGKLCRSCFEQGGGVH